MFRVCCGGCVVFMVMLIRPASVSAGTVYTGVILERHFRYYEPQNQNDPPKAFIGDDLTLNPLPLDFSGVGIGVRGIYRGFGTMISPSCFYATGHAKPDVGSIMTFYEGNIRDDEYKHEYQVKDYVYYPGMAAIGRLCEVGDPDTLADVTADGIASYPIWWNNSWFLPASFAGRNIYISTKKWDSGSGQDVDMVARNVLASWETEHISSVSWGSEDEEHGGLAIDEYVVQYGDSGSPIFFLWNNRLGLLDAISCNALGPYVGQIRYVLQQFGEDVSVLINGDLSGDGFVGGDDLDILLMHWGQNVTPGDMSHGDFSGDGFVGGDDLDAVLSCWGNSGPAPGDPLPGSYITTFADADLNEDGFVGADDLDILRLHWGTNVTPGDRLHGDPSGNGFVGADDLDIVRSFWGQSVPPPGVPEPSTPILMVCGLLLLGASCWRRRLNAPHPIFPGWTSPAASPRPTGERGRPG